MTQADDYCEICGRDGQVVGAIVFDHLGRQIRITIHIACENSRVARMAERRAKARLN